MPKSESQNLKQSETKKRLIASGELVIMSMKDDYVPWNQGKTVADDPRIQTSVVNMRKAIAGQHPSPSNLENRIFSLVMYYGLPYDFIGDCRKQSIGGRYPDFILHSETECVVVEVADKHEKEFRKGYSWQQYESDSIKHYTTSGYQCILLWSDMSDKQIVKILKDVDSNFT